MSTQKLIILKGLPASGKSTYARAWVNEDPKSRVIVNRDNIRKMLGPYWVPSREKLVTGIEDLMVEEALYHNFNVIVDATNLKPTNKWLDLVNTLNGVHNPYKLELEYKHFTEVPLEVCIARDKIRTGDDKVGETVIRSMYNKIKPQQNI